MNSSMTEKIYAKPSIYKEEQTMMKFCLPRKLFNEQSMKFFIAPFVSFNLVVNILPERLEKSNSILFKFRIGFFSDYNFDALDQSMVEPPNLYDPYALLPC